MVTVNKVLEELHLPVNDTQIKIKESDIEKIYQHAKKELPMRHADCLQVQKRMESRL